MSHRISIIIWGMKCRAISVMWEVFITLWIYRDGMSRYRAINTWAVPVLRYGAGVINSRIDELKNIDIKTRKMLRYNGHHPQGDVDRLYVSWERVGRGLQSIEEVVKQEENAMTTYFTESTKPEIKILANTMAREGILKGDVIDKEKNKSNNETVRLEK